MKQHILILKAMVLAGIGILIFSGYAAAPQNVNIYKGELASGSAKVGNLSSNEMWLLYGEKDSRVVISTAVDRGKAPPEIYLYPPEGSEYEVHSGVVSDRSQVLDYKIKSAGKYVVFIHPCDQQDTGTYKIAYVTLDPGESYSIEPDAPDGALIKETSANKTESKQTFIDRSGGIIPGSILFDLVTFGVGPALFTAFTGVDRAVFGAQDVNNKIEVASRDIKEPAGQCNIRLAKNGPMMDPLTGLR